MNIPTLLSVLTAHEPFKELLRISDKRQAEWVARYALSIPSTPHPAAIWPKASHQACEPLMLPDTRV